MKRGWLILLAVVVVALGLGAAYFVMPGQAPGGQTSLVEMNGAALSAMQAEFNRRPENVRVILLLSPT